MILQKFPEHQFRSFMELWKKSFFELSSLNQDLLMHHIKLIFEGVMQHNAKNLAEYEEFRYDYRGKRDYINIELECNICKKLRYITFPFINSDIFKFPFNDIN